MSIVLFEAEIVIVVQVMIMVSAGGRKVIALILIPDDLAYNLFALPPLPYPEPYAGLYRQFL